MAAKEIQAIIEAHARACARGERAALATVVKTSGSTYRRAGARMWIGAAGDAVGSISGGCLEDDARDRAREVIASGQSAMIHYDTTVEGDVLWGSGVGCQGVVHVLVEPLPTPAADGGVELPSSLDCLAEGLRRRGTSVLATVFQVENTSRVAAGEFFWCAEPMTTSAVNGAPASRHVHSTIADAAFAETVQREARRASQTGVARVQTCELPGGGKAEVFIDVIRPPQALLILGAGHDAVPLARLAGELGWRVRVADRRRAYATPERFPTATEVVQCPAHHVGTDRLPVEAGEAVVVMTHNYLQDLAILRAVLPSPAGYIGLLGPTRRKEILLRELALAPFGDDLPTEETSEEAADPAGGIPWMKPASLRRIHGPAGLDIGAEAPEQIALSILAEIEAHAARRRGGSLKRRRQPLHDVIPKTALPARSGGARKPAGRPLAAIKTA